ncbi:MAG: hypothetical protein PHO03_00210 [Candidatus Omnitrophica bacterium]|nr:hypothetical protein [Candidatus Omnitrophota bacterium]
MLRIFKNRRAQSTMEYALLIAVVIGVFSAMQIYMRRSMQAKVKSGADNMSTVVLQGTEAGDKTQALFGTEKQYEPYYIREGQYQFSTESTEGREAGVVTEAGGKKEVTGATVSRTGTQQITGAKEE